MPEIHSINVRTNTDAFISPKTSIVPLTLASLVMAAGAATVGVALAGFIPYQCLYLGVGMIAIDLAILGVCLARHSRQQPQITIEESDPDTWPVTPLLIAEQTTLYNGVHVYDSQNPYMETTCFPESFIPQQLVLRNETQIHEEESQHRSLSEDEMPSSSGIQQTNVELPPEILVLLYQNLTAADLSQVALVSNSWNQTARDTLFIRPFISFIEEHGWYEENPNYRRAYFLLNRLGRSERPRESRIRIHCNTASSLCYTSFHSNSWVCVNPTSINLLKVDSQQLNTPLTIEKRWTTNRWLNLTALGHFENTLYIAHGSREITIFDLETGTSTQHILNHRQTDAATIISITVMRNIILVKHQLDSFYNSDRLARWSFSIWKRSDLTLLYSSDFDRRFYVSMNDRLYPESGYVFPPFPPKQRGDELWVYPESGYISSTPKQKWFKNLMLAYKDRVICLWVSRGNNSRNPDFYEKKEVKILVEYPESSRIETILKTFIERTSLDHLPLFNMHVNGNTLLVQFAPGHPIHIYDLETKKWLHDLNPGEDSKLIGALAGMVITSTPSSVEFKVFDYCAPSPVINS